MTSCALSSMPARAAPTSASSTGAPSTASNVASPAARVDLRRDGRSGGLAKRVAGRAPPSDRIRDLHDLEHVDDVHRERQRDDAYRGRGDRGPEMPDAVRAEGDEPRAESAGRKGQAPQPDRDGGARLRVATAEETVVQVRLITFEHALAVLQPPQDDERR